MTEKPNRRLLRHEVPVEITWDLTALYATPEEWKTVLESMDAKTDAIAAYKPILTNTPQNLLQCLRKYEAARIDLHQLGAYASLRRSGDSTNAENQEGVMAFAAVDTRFLAETAFIESAIIALDEDTFKRMLDLEPGLAPFKIYLEKVYARKAHQLSPETEQALAALSGLVNAPQNIYRLTKSADMKLDPFVDDEGNEYDNSINMFEGRYSRSTNASVRRNGYASFVKTLTLYKNTLATVYGTEVRKQVALSKLRGYDSVQDMLLDPQEVTREMYENQLDIIFNELAPHMRKYATLIKEQMGLEKMYFCDLKATIPTDYNPPVSMEYIRELVTEALGVLGEDYQNMVKRAFAERWIDYGDNVGKGSGAFCNTPYNAHPFILMTYTGQMRNAFTIAHELGHGGHFYNATRSQRILDVRPSRYFTEAPSTMNEMLLAQHLLKQSDDPKLKQWVIVQLLGTYYHNFVTHLIEGEFQRRVYTAAERGVSLTASMLCKTMKDIMTEFWGDAVEIREEDGMTWMRQAHYYMGLYPYTYSAGLTASTAVAQQIAEEGQPAVDRWLKVLRAGGTMKPDELMKAAGIDMTNPAPIKKAVDYVGSLISEVIELYQTI